MNNAAASANTASPARLHSTLADVPLMPTIDCFAALMGCDDGTAIAMLRVAFPRPDTSGTVVAVPLKDTGRPVDALDWAVRLRGATRLPAGAAFAVPWTADDNDDDFSGSHAVCHARPLLPEVPGSRRCVLDAACGARVVTGTVSALLQRIRAKAGTAIAVPVAIDVDNAGPAQTSLASQLAELLPRMQGLRELNVARCSVVDLGRRFAQDVSETLERVTLPATLRVLGADAFSAFNRLRSLDLSSCRALVSIGGGFARGCPALESVRLPPTVQALGDWFCAECPSLQLLDLRNTGVLSVGRHFAAGCASLADVWFAGALATVHSGCCAGCPALRCIDLGEAQNLRVSSLRMRPDAWPALEFLVVPFGFEWSGLPLPSETEIVFARHRPARSAAGQRATPDDAVVHYHRAA